MDTLFVWVKNIVSFLLILTLVYQLLPTKDYGKYVRVSAGMILLIVVISPLVTAMGLEENLDFYLSWESLKSQMEVDFLDGLALEDQKMENIMKEYKKNLEEQIRRTLKSGGYEAGNIVLTVNSKQTDETFGQIISMEIYNLKKMHQTNGQEPASETVKGVEIQPINIGETKAEENVIDSETIIVLKKQLAGNFYMDMNQILINGG